MNLTNLFRKDDEDGDRRSGVAVIGLGRFGSSLAMELVKQNVEVLGIDSDPKLVQSLSDHLTHAVAADSTDEVALRQLSVHEFKRAVVGIGTDLEASILTASMLLSFGIPTVWAKAVSLAHGRILEQIGVHHVVYPEHDMGTRVAHLVRGRMLDYIEFEDDFALVKIRPPRILVGTPLGEINTRKDYGITVVALKRRDGDFQEATPEAVIDEGDVIVVAGPTPQVERFSDMN